jgi:hypothetical protein
MRMRNFESWIVYGSSSGKFGIENPSFGEKGVGSRECVMCGWGMCRYAVDFKADNADSTAEPPSEQVEGMGKLSSRLRIVSCMSRRGCENPVGNAFRGEGRFK